MNDFSTTLTRLGDLDLDRGELLWQRLVRSVAQIGASIGPISQTVALLSSKGKLTEDLAKRYVDWMQAANKVLADTAMLIEQNPNLRDAIDAVGAQDDATSGLGSMLDGVSRPSDTIIALLKAPLPVMGPKALRGLGDTAHTLVRYAGPAWKKLMELISNRGVVIVGASAVAADTVRDLVGTDIDLEEQRAVLLQKLQDKLVESGVDPDSAYEMALRALGQTKTGADAPLLWLAGGAAGLGLLLFWLKRQGVTVVNVPGRRGD